MNALPTDPDEEALVRAAAAGRDAAFTQLMRRHKAELYRFIRRYVGDADEAYDVLQDSFVAAWKALDRYDPARPFEYWLKRIALNKCRDWARRRTVRRWLGLAGATPFDAPLTLADDTPTAETSLADRQDLMRLDRAIAALPAKLKEPLLLSVLEEMPHEAVGQLLGISAKAVETRVYRARRKLAEAMRLPPDSLA